MSYIAHRELKVIADFLIAIPYSRNHRIRLSSGGGDFIPVLLQWLRVQP